MPKVSVIVPVYNVEEFLPKCLDSLVNQTLDDIEIIVVNDGSPDNSQAIIDKFAGKYPDKIKAFTKKNGGLSDARNFGMKHAVGEFIGFVDSDDYVELTMFEKLYNRAVTTDSDVVVCGHNAITYKKNGEIKSLVVNKLPHAHLLGKSIYEVPEILAFAKSYAWNKLYKREVLEGYEFPVGQWFEDSAVVYNILSSAKKVEGVNEPLYNYIVGRSGAITSTIDERVFDIFKSCEALISHYKKIGKFDELYNEIESLCLLHIHVRFAAFNKSGKLDLKLRYVDTAFDFIEKYFPNWENNEYYLKRRSVHLAVYPVKRFQIAKNSRKTLRSFYKMLHLYKFLEKAFFLKFLERAFKKCKRILKRVKRGIIRRLKPQVATAPKAGVNGLSSEELRELQLVTFDILKTVVEFCNKHNLRYYLSEGSLLGAIRHGGFIPWDDDMDIAMPRDDYEKFLKLWNTDIHNECRLFHQSTYPKYYLTFAKVIFMGKCHFTSLIRKKLKSMNEIKGPGIDIFPLDETIPLSTELFARASKIRKYRNILLTKVNYIKKPKKRKLYRTKSHLMSYKALHKKLTALYTADHGKGEQYLTNFASAYNIAKEVFPKEYFEPARTVKFEGLDVTVPAKAEEVLTCIYGDFMTPPPVENRVCPHSYSVKK